jgi:transcriptional regulator with XRE-family HTH domain
MIIYLMMPPVNALGNRLKELRAAKSLNQVSQESGIDRGQLRRYEAGRIPEDALIVKLAEYYQVSYQELKGLSFESLYPVGSLRRQALFNWVQRSSQEL